MRRAAVVLGVLALACVLAFSLLQLVRQAPDAQLDPDRIVIVRTPGGMLEVSTLIKNEEFGWSSRYECPLIDCGWLLKPTISTIRIPVHYTYRVPLADNWSIVRKQSRYELTVPPEQPKLPVAMDLSRMQLKTTKGWLSPGTEANRELLLRQLGAELQRRSTAPAYIASQRAAARKTIAEFAHKWMREQGVGSRLNGLPVKVIFDGEAAASEP